jgi:hypothetical protein
MTKQERFSEAVRHMASGQTALLLMEGLLLNLVEKRIIEADELIDMVQTIIETKRQLVEDEAEDEVAKCAIAMLATIENTLIAAGQTAPAG